MKTNFLVKAPKSVIRVNEKFIRDSYRLYMYESENDFYLISFNTKKEMNEAFKDICHKSGESFYIDNEFNTFYIAISGNIKSCEECKFIASMITPYKYL